MSAVRSQHQADKSLAPEGWHENSGHPPIFLPDYDDQPCPPHLFTEDEAGTGQVLVRLRNGRVAKGSWPVRRGTRWTLTGNAYDIEFYRKA